MTYNKDIQVRQCTEEKQSMSLEKRISALKAKHQSLEVAIQEEQNRPHPDDLQISNLKKQKLRIKDEIVTLSSHQ